MAQTPAQPVDLEGIDELFGDNPISKSIVDRIGSLSLVFLSPL